MEASEFHKSKRQLLELLEQKDIEISEKNVTIKTYLDKIVCISLWRLVTLCTPLGFFSESLWCHLGFYDKLYGGYCIFRTVIPLCSWCEW